MCINLLETYYKNLTVSNPCASFCSAFLEKSRSSSSFRGFMSVVGNRYLVFRLGGIGFLLDLAAVVEIINPISAALDPGRSDLGQGIVSALQFRQTWIPAVDPALRLDIFSAVKLQDKVAVILHGSEGNWALLVDQVEDLSAKKNFQACEIPFLLKVAALGFYSRLKLLQNEPMIVFEPELYYGSTAVSI